MISESAYRGKHCWVMPLGSPPTCVRCGEVAEEGVMPFGPCPKRQLTDAEKRIAGLREIHRHFEALYFGGVQLASAHELGLGYRLAEALLEQSELVEHLRDQLSQLQCEHDRVLAVISRNRELTVEPVTVKASAATERG